MNIYEKTTGLYFSSRFEFQQYARAYIYIEFHFQCSRAGFAVHEERRTLVYPITQYPMWVVVVSPRPLARDAQTSTRINLHRTGASFRIFVEWEAHVHGHHASMHECARSFVALRARFQIGGGGKAQGDSRVVVVLVLLVFSLRGVSRHVVWDPVRP